MLGNQRLVRELAILIGLPISVLFCAKQGMCHELIPLAHHQVLQAAYDLASLPRVGEYSNSGCLAARGRTPSEGYPWCGEDQILLTVGPGTLNVLHANATYNCCPDDIVVSLSIEGSVLRLTEEERLDMGGCDCMCCYDVEATVVNLTPGTYTVEFCWQDWETPGELCHVEDIIVPEAQPRIGGYSNSGCLPGSDRAPSDEYPWCGEDQILLSAAPGTLDVLHRQATYNCCPDDIVISLSVDGRVLHLTEEEVLSTPCFCMCCFDVQATIVNLAPGLYTVEFCWNDYETNDVQCHYEDIVIPP